MTVECFNCEEREEDFFYFIGVTAMNSKLLLCQTQPHEDVPTTTITNNHCTPAKVRHPKERSSVAENLYKFDEHFARGRGKKLEIGAPSTTQFVGFINEFSGKYTK